jgi:hypothetical protein
MTEVPLTETRRLGPFGQIEPSTNAGGGLTAAHVALPHATRRRGSDAHLATPAAASHSSLGASLNDATEEGSPLLPTSPTKMDDPSSRMLDRVHRLSREVDSMACDEYHRPSQTPPTVVISAAVDGDDGDEYASPPRAMVDEKHDDAVGPPLRRRGTMPPTTGDEAGGLEPTAALRLAVELKQLAAEVSDTINQLKVERHGRALCSRDLDALSCENVELTAVVESLLSDVEELKDMVECLRRDRDELFAERSDRVRQIADLSEGAEGAARVYEDMKSALAESFEQIAELSAANEKTSTSHDALQSEIHRLRSEVDKLSLDKMNFLSTVQQQSLALDAVRAARLQDEEKFTRLHLATLADLGVQSLRRLETVDSHRLRTAAAELKAEIAQAELARETVRREALLGGNGDGLESVVTNLRSQVASLTRESTSIRRVNEAWVRQIAIERDEADVRNLGVAETADRRRVEGDWAIECAAIAFVALRYRPAALLKTERPAALPTTASPVKATSPRPHHHYPLVLSPTSPLSQASASSNVLAMDRADESVDATRRDRGTNTRHVHHATCGCDPISSDALATKPDAAATNAAAAVAEKNTARIAELEELATSQLEVIDSLQRRLADDTVRVRELEDAFAAEVDKQALAETERVAALRRCDELEQVVCAVEADRAHLARSLHALKDDGTATQRALEAKLELLMEDLRKSQHGRNEKLVADTAPATADVERASALAQLEVLEVKNQLLQARAELQHATTRALYADGELSAMNRELNALRAEQADAKSRIHDALEGIDSYRSRAAEAEQRALALQESRARHALQHEWALYAVQRGYHAAIRRGTAVLS